MNAAIDIRKSIVKGSLADVAAQQHQSLAQTFVNAECVVIVDTSGSMSAQDSKNGQSRYDVACSELAQLQTSLPGKIAVLSFSSMTVFCPDGKPAFLGESTNLADALTFAKVADLPGMRMIVISDGEPDQPEKCFAVAKTYKAKIDVIFVGPENLPAGRNFLAKLASISGGQVVTADRAQGLLLATQKLLATA